MSITIWHNPRCSKSRQTLQILQDRGIEPEIRLYLDAPPSQDEIQAALRLLGCDARAAMRSGEAIYKELDLGNSALDEDALIRAMAEHPILIERPIVMSGDQARIGRPPESVLEILGD